MLCEMCGSKEAKINAIVEGTMLNICKECAKHGEVIEVRKPEIVEDKKIERVKAPEQEVLDIIEANYAERIKSARERKGLTQKDLAEKISEKESVIHNLESGGLEPSFALAKKLEKFLEIKLVSLYKEENKKQNLDIHNNNLTIGDLLKLK